MSSGLFAPEDLARAGSMVQGPTSSGDGAARALAPPAPPDEPETPPSETPEATPPAAKPVEPATPPADHSDQIERLEKMQKETQAALDSLAKELVAEKRAEGDKRSKAEILGDAAEDSPLAKLYDELQGVKGELKTLRDAETARTEQAENDRIVAETMTRLENEAEMLLKRFPGLSEADLDQVWDWMDKNPAQASRTSVSLVAEQVLGYDYLDARRKPAGAPDPKGPRPGPPAARIVTEGAPGGGAAPPPSATPGPALEGVRGAFVDIARDPASLARLGKHE